MNLIRDCNQLTHRWTSRIDKGLTIKSTNVGKGKLQWRIYTISYKFLQEINFLTIEVNIKLLKDCPNNEASIQSHDYIYDQESIVIPPKTCHMKGLLLLNYYIN